MKARGLRLSELLGEVKEVLHGSMPDSVWVRAEIMELQVNRSGHCYLELIEKDPENNAILARCRATIWASRYQNLRSFFEASTDTPLRSGLKILCRATVNFHPQYGFSLNIIDLDPAYTLGDLARKKQEVILRLRREGVFDMNRELPFPQVAQRIAIVSSESAAGYGDFVDSLNHNAPGFAFYHKLFPALMQGDEAPNSICAALDQVYACEESFDVVVLIRGGGSRADLECFNNYDLACHISQFPLPIITGIGHERDESVADMVAARRLKTPTAVAGFLIDGLLSFEFRLSALHEKLELLLGRIVNSHHSKLDRMETKLGLVVPGFLTRLKTRADQQEERLQSLAGQCLRQAADHLHLLESKTALIRPENILKRGYTITLCEGKSITNPDEIKAGSRIETRFHNGIITSTVDKNERR